MKQLLLVRHAKSSWAEAGQSDFDRPLNDRGLHDAPMIARRVLDRGVEIDAFISSPAKRALTTCRRFAEVFGKEEAIETIDKLYHAMPAVFAQVIASIGNEINTAAIFSHNPGITSFVNSLCSTRVDDMPTCAVFAVQAETDDWEQFKTAKKTFWFFDYPKA